MSGLTEDRTLFAGMPLVFMEIDAAQELVYRGQDLATAVLVDGEPTSVPDGYAVLSNEAVAEDAMRPLEKSVSSVNIIRVLLWFVAAMIIGTMVYLSALERRRDVAVLKAIGGSTTRLGASIALQGALIALDGRPARRGAAAVPHAGLPAGGVGAGSAPSCRCP